MSGIDEPGVRALLSEAAETAVPPAFDPAAAAATGRRRRFRRRVAGSVTALGAVAVLGLGGLIAVNISGFRPAVPAGGVTAGPPSAAAELGDISPQRVAGVQVGGELVAAIRGTDGRVWTRGGVGSSTAWRALAGQVTTSPALAADGDGTVYLAARGAGGDVLLRIRRGGADGANGGWTDWRSLGGATNSAPSLAYVPGARALLVTALGNQRIDDQISGRKEVLVALVNTTSAPPGARARWRTAAGSLADSSASGVSGAPLVSVGMPPAAAGSAASECPREAAVISARGSDRRTHAAVFCPPDLTGSAGGPSVRPRWSSVFGVDNSSTAAVVGRWSWYRGLDGQLWQSGGDEAPTVVGAPPANGERRIAGTPTAITTADVPTSNEVSKVRVFVRDTDGGAWMYSPVAGAGGDWTSLGGDST